MKRAFLLGCGILAASAMAMATETQEMTTLRIYDGCIFYDGYAGLNRNPYADADDGILRHRNSLYSTRLTEDQLNSIGEHLNLKVTVEACCDNYDRIGNVNLAFVNKGEETYDPNEVQRIEIGRFITPFMDKNKEPNQVPYAYNIDYVSNILRDSRLRASYDIWLEFEIFGIPYAANNEIEGCAGRSDVFKGYLDFETSVPALPMTDDNILIPIVIKNPEYVGGNLNNYQSSATDNLGFTNKTYRFSLDEDVADAQIVLVTSNHGANENGEEYNRRWHYVDFDEENVLMYKPGRTSCEPFRVYNTQANGIYTLQKRTERMWQSFSNWCPGDVIDNRIIHLGPVAAGDHEIYIDVPEAVFPGKQGDIPVSMFVQASKTGTLPQTGIEGLPVPEAAFTVTTDGHILSVNTPRTVEWLEIHDLQGRCLRRQRGNDSVDTSSWVSGTYLVSVEDTEGVITTLKISL